MPLTAKGQKIMSAMKEKYGSEEGERVFYASRNKGTITGVDHAVVPGDPTRDYMDACSQGDSEGCVTKARGALVR